ncbi:hypothetical protein D3C84_979330 [compost metagenome]
MYRFEQAHLEVVGVEKQNCIIEAIHHQAFDRACLLVLTDVHLAFNARYPAKHCIGGLVDAVEQTQDRQGHGNDNARQDDGDHQGGDNAHQLAFATDHVVDGGA